MYRHIYDLHGLSEPATLSGPQRSGKNAAEAPTQA